MKNHIHKFSFVSSSPEKGGRSFTPFLKIILQNHTKADVGQISITPELISKQEILAYVGELKKDLDRVAYLATQELEKLNSRNLN